MVCLKKMNVELKHMLIALFEKLKEEIKQELLEEIKTIIASNNNSDIPKEFYSYKELSRATGLTIGAIKGRRRRGTIKVVYEGTTPLLPKAEFERLIANLKKQQV